MFGGNFLGLLRLISDESLLQITALAHHATNNGVLLSEFAMFVSAIEKYKPRTSF